MATLENDFDFTGSIGKMSAYRMKGTDKIILRKKGGPTKKQVRQGLNFSHTRLNNMEFAGAVKAVKGLRSTLFPLHRLADYNFTPQLTSLCRKIQQQDPVNGKGERSVLISTHRDLLAGFRLNKKHPFGTVITTPVGHTLNREDTSATVQLPRLISGINLLLPWKHPAYRFILVLSVARDVTYNGTAFPDVPWLKPGEGVMQSTEWFVSGAPFLPRNIELRLNMPEALKDDETMVLSIGIEMGTPGREGKTESVRYAGSACILGAG